MSIIPLDEAQPVISPALEQQKEDDDIGDGDEFSLVA